MNWEGKDESGRAFALRGDSIDEDGQFESSPRQEGGGRIDRPPPAATSRRRWQATPSSVHRCIADRKKPFKFRLGNPIAAAAEPIIAAPAAVTSVHRNGHRKRSESTDASPGHPGRAREAQRRGRPHGAERVDKSQRKNQTGNHAAAKPPPNPFRAPSRSNQPSGRGLLETLPLSSSAVAVVASLRVRRFAATFFTLHCQPSVNESAANERPLSFSISTTPTEGGGRSVFLGRILGAIRDRIAAEHVDYSSRPVPESALPEIDRIARSAHHFLLSCPPRELRTKPKKTCQIKFGILQHVARLEPRLGDQF